MKSYIYNKRVLCLVSGLVLLGSWSSALGDGGGLSATITSRTSIPMPCKEQLSREAGAIGKCSVLYESCDKTYEVFEELVIEQVMKDRLQRLYYGYNDLPKFDSSGKPVASVPAFMNNAKHSSVCNMSCGEGKVTGDDGVSLNPSISNALDGGETSANVDAWNIPKGVLAGVDLSKEHSSVPGRSLESCGSWPTWQVGDDDHPRLNDVSQYALMSVDFLKADSDRCQNDPTSFAEDGDGDDECHGVLIGEFRRATAISSRQLGVFAQLHWMKLKEVLDEAKAGQLRLTNAACSDLAVKTYDQMLKAAIQLDQSKVCVSGGNYKSATKCNDTGEATDAIAQRDCQVRAILAVFETMSIPAIAECEVYARASDAYKAKQANLLKKFKELRKDAVFQCRMTLRNLDLEKGLAAGRNGALETMENRIRGCFPTVYASLVYKYLKSEFPMVAGFQDGFASKGGKVKINSCQVTLPSRSTGGGK